MVPSRLQTKRWTKGKSGQSYVHSKTSTTWNMKPERYLLLKDVRKELYQHESTVSSQVEPWGNPQGIIYLSYSVRDAFVPCTPSGADNKKVITDDTIGAARPKETMTTEATVSGWRKKVSEVGWRSGTSPTSGRRGWEERRAREVGGSVELVLSPKVRWDHGPMKTHGQILDHEPMDQNSVVMSSF